MLADRLSATFAALADPTRHAILVRLASGEAAVKELAAPFAMTPPAVTKHLKVLQRAGRSPAAAGRSGGHAGARSSRCERLPIGWSHTAGSGTSGSPVSTIIWLNCRRKRKNVVEKNDAGPAAAVRTASSGGEFAVARGYGFKRVLNQFAGYLAGAMRQTPMNAAERSQAHRGRLVHIR